MAHVGDGSHQEGPVPCRFQKRRTRSWASVAHSGRQWHMGLAADVVSKPQRSRYRYEDARSQQGRSRWPRLLPNCLGRGGSGPAAVAGWGRET